MNKVMWFCAGHGNVSIVQVYDKYDGVFFEDTDYGDE